MYTKRNYGFFMTLNWSKKPLLVGLLYAALLFLLFYFIQLKLYIPWQPLGVIGIAVAFYLGFKNNSSYDRTWEARKIWGSMVNNSRCGVDTARSKSGWRSKWDEICTMYARGRFGSKKCCQVESRAGGDGEVADGV